MWGEGPDTLHHSLKKEYEDRSHWLRLETREEPKFRVMWGDNDDCLEYGAVR
jgi:hypothetical protein